MIRDVFECVDKMSDKVLIPYSPGLFLTVHIVA